MRTTSPPTNQADRPGPAAVLDGAHQRPARPVSEAIAASGEGDRLGSSPRLARQRARLMAALGPAMQRQAPEEGHALQMSRPSPRTGAPVVQRVKILPVWKMWVSHENRDAFVSIVGAVKDTADLAPENLEALYKLLQDDPAGKQIRTEIEAAHGGVTPPDTDEALAAEEEHERSLLSDALGAFGDTWQDALPKIEKWWSTLKEAEAADTFESAFRGNRMTARQINVGATARGGAFPVKHATAEGRERPMTLARGIGDIVERGKPENFHGPDGRNQKNERGLHDLSASLLDGSRTISSQLKHYDEAVVLFMPVPEENDLRIISALARLKGADEDRLSEMRSMMTRLKLAQASDMGTSFVDISGEGAEHGEFRYGITGTVIRRKGGIGMPAIRAEIAARRTNALQYKKILESGITKVNEVVIAYRAHESELFPMFAAWDAGMQIYLVLNADLSPTGMSITNDGRYRQP